MENKTNILHTSGKITLAFLAFVLMFVCWIGNVFPYGTQSGTLLDLRRGSRVTDYMFYQPFADTYTMYFGTQSVTGSGTTGYIPGTSTALPRLLYNASALTFNFAGATLQNEGVDVTVSSDLSGYIAVTGGTGTGNVLTNTTLDGTGTVSANVTLSGNITANSLLITPTELSSVNNATGEIQAQITTATGSITNHVHTGADGTTQIAHDSITGTGTYAHSAIDTHIDNGYDPHGGTLTQTAATIAGVSAPYIAQTSGTGTDITLAGTTIMSGDVYFPGGIIQSDGDAGFGTTNPNTQVHTYKSTNGTLESKIENPNTGTAARIIHRLSNNASSAGMVYTGSNYSSGGRIFSFFQNDAAGITQFWNAGVKALEFDILGNSTFIGTVTASNFVGNVGIGNIGGIVITSPAEGHKLVFDSSLNVVNATDTAITAWSGITGNPTDNGSVSVSSGAGYIPVSGSDGKLDYGWQKDVIRLTGTTTSPEAGAYGQLYVQSSVARPLGSFGTLTAGSLVSYYRLEDTADSFGTNTLTNYGGTTFVAGKYGNAASFNGTTQYLQTSVLSSATTNISMFGWVYIPDTSRQGAFFANGYDNGYTVGIGGTDISNNGNDLILVLGAVEVIDTNTTIGTGWHHVGATRDGTTWRCYIDSVQCTTTSTTSPATPTTAFLISAHAGGYFYNDKVDDVVFYNKCLSAGEIIELYNNTGNVPFYTQYAAKYIDPINGNTVFEILTPGTATTEASYIYNNVTTTVWGLGTNTAITSGTASGYYAGWTNRPIRVSAIDIASTKKIKENIKPIHIKPGRLEAESKAKPVYIAEGKPAWFTANEVNYTYVGSDTATYADTAAMESDYASYIELEWASDLNQNVYIEAVQRAQQKYFWGLFDKIQPKSWNPIDDLRMTRKGLVVEEVPDEIKGADGQSIDQMAVVTYQTLVLQELKDGVVDIMQALKDLANTGTFTTKSIDARLEVMRVAQ